EPAPTGSTRGRLAARSAGGRGEPAAAALLGAAARLRALRAGRLALAGARTGVGRAGAGRTARPRTAGVTRATRGGLADRRGGPPAVGLPADRRNHAHGPDHVGPRGRAARRRRRTRMRGRRVRRRIGRRRWRAGARARAVVVGSLAVPRRPGSVVRNR